MNNITKSALLCVSIFLILMSFGSNALAQRKVPPPRSQDSAILFAAAVVLDSDDNVMGYLKDFDISSMSIDSKNLGRAYWVQGLSNQSKWIAAFKNSISEEISVTVVKPNIGKGVYHLDKIKISGTYPFENGPFAKTTKLVNLIPINSGGFYIALFGLKFEKDGNLRFSITSNAPVFYTGETEPLDKLDKLLPILRHIRTAYPLGKWESFLDKSLK